MEKTDRTPSFSIENAKHVSHTQKEEVVVSNMFTNAASATEKEHKMGLIQGSTLR